MSWSSVELQEISDIKGGGRLKLSANDFVEDGFPAYGAGGMNGRLPVAEFDRDAVILSAIGARCGKCFLAEGQWTSLANTQLIFPDEAKVNVRFLWYQLNDEARWPRSGVAQPFIKPAHVKSHKIILPPLEEQKRIAGILDQADQLRRLRARALEKVNTLGQSIFQEMFGDVDRGRLAPLKSLGDVKTGSTPSTKKPEYFDGPVPFITPGDLEAARAPARWLTEEGAEKSRLVGQGATLVCCIGTIGKMDIAKSRCAFNQQINAVDWGDEILPEYGFFAVRGIRSEIERIGRGASTTLPILKKSLFQGLEIPVVPIEEQNFFGQRFRQAALIVSEMGTSEQKLETLFTSLQHRAFRGEL